MNKTYRKLNKDEKFWVGSEVSFRTKAGAVVEATFELTAEDGKGNQWAVVSVGDTNFVKSFKSLRKVEYSEELAASLQKGLEQSAAGNVADMGDFTQYADDPLITEHTTNPYPAGSEAAKLYAATLESLNETTGQKIIGITWAEDKPPF